jgi:outer membrane protein assembly factor BamB
MDELTTTVAAVDRIDVESVPVTTTSPIQWSDPSGWRSRSFAAVSVDPTFGEGPVSGTPADLAPVITESGLVFRVVAGVDDLLAFGPYETGTWRSLWRLHPGGRLLSTAAFGNVVVASTSRRQVVAYTDRGRRLWTLDLDELAFAAPVRLSATTLAVVDLAGSVVAVDIATGTMRWRATTGSGVPTPPAVAGDVLVVADDSGAVTAYDVLDGSRRWQQEIDQYHGAAGAGEVAVLLGEQTANGVGIGDGRRRWMKPFRGTYQSITSFADGAVLTSRAGSYLVGADGTLRPLARAYQILTPAADRAVGWGTDRAEVLDGTGKVLAGRDVPPLTVTSGARDAVATRDGVLLLRSDWSVDSWGG